MIFLAAAFFLISGCGKDRLLKKNSLRQHFVDISSKLPPMKTGTIKMATFGRANQDSMRDLVILYEEKGKGSRIIVLINEGEARFVEKKDRAPVSEVGTDIHFLAVGDFDGDHAGDLAMIAGPPGSASVLIRFNNKKGYFYRKENYFFPPIHKGIERIDLVDIDHDLDLDLFLTGKRVLDFEGRLKKIQAQLIINNGKGEFQDATTLLLPPIPPGIVGTSFADYDDDGVRDVFLIYGNGQNRLLINNSLGKFTDRTDTRLPFIKDPSVHADWADFDQDGDNDLLVINRSVGGSRGDNYFLENDGKGSFKKRSHKLLADFSSSQVYLLDANGNGIPDAILLGPQNTRYLKGKGKWGFSLETEKRFPRSTRFARMVFGDIDDDGYLDIFGITAKNRQGRLWLNRFD